MVEGANRYNRFREALEFDLSQYYLIFCTFRSQSFEEFILDFQYNQLYSAMKDLPFLFARNSKKFVYGESSSKTFISELFTIGNFKKDHQKSLRLSDVDTKDLFCWKSCLKTTVH